MPKLRFSVLLAIIAVAVLSRILPHPYNFTPITGIALFGGAHFANKKQAYLIPLGALILSDLVIGFHRLLPLIYIYFIVTVSVGTWLGKKRNPWMIAGTTLACSLVFFFLTNFAVWFFDGLYPHTMDGLAQCFAAAIPFFHNTALGDAFYAVLLFGGFALAEKSFPVLQIQNS